MVNHSSVHIDLKVSKEGKPSPKRLNHIYQADYKEKGDNEVEEDMLMNLRREF